VTEVGTVQFGQDLALARSGDCNDRAAGGAENNIRDIVDCDVS
jgi:hypothetical protein